MIEDLVAWPAPYVAPAHVRAAIRGIDPGADLFYLADGTWALAARREPWQLPDGGRRRRQTGLTILRREMRKGAPNRVRLRAAQLLVAGFGIVAQVRLDRAPDQEIVDWFRHADWEERTGGFDAAFDARMAESDGTAAEARMGAQLEDWRATEGRSLWRHVFKGRRSVITPGMSGLN